MTFQPKSYRTDGGDKYVTASGGEHEVQSGGTLDLNSGAIFTDNRFLTSAASAADSLAIPVTAKYCPKTTGADAEALTLADSVAGHVLTVVLVTDGGGDGTLTPATSSGFATVVFADAGDSATFKFIDGTVGWVLVGTGGVAAPPVITV